MYSIRDARIFYLHVLFVFLFSVDALIFRSIGLTIISHYRYFITSFTLHYYNYYLRWLCHFQYVGFSWRRLVGKILHPLIAPVKILLSNPLSRDEYFISYFIVFIGVALTVSISAIRYFFLYPIGIANAHIAFVYLHRDEWKMCHENKLQVCSWQLIVEKNIVTVCKLFAYLKIVILTYRPESNVSLNCSNVMRR